MLPQMALFHSFLWLITIPLCIYIYIYVTTSSLPIPLSMDTHFASMSLAIMNTADMNMGCMRLSRVLFCFDVLLIKKQL